MSAGVRDIRRSALVIGCGDSDLRARIAYYWSDVRYFDRVQASLRNKSSV